MNTASHRNANTRSPATALLLLALVALAACQPPRGVMSPAREVSAPAAAMPAPQEPFDTTPITPVESAGASGG
jgi:hypothetical protein